MAADTPSPAQAAAATGQRDAAPELDPALETERARLAELVQGAYDYLPAALAGYLAGASVIAMLYWRTAPARLLAPWFAAFVVVCVVRALTMLRFRRDGPRTFEQWMHWRTRANIGTIVAGCLWGATGWIFYGISSQQPQTTGLIVIIYTFCVAGIPVLSTQPVLYRTYAGLSLLPLIVRIAMVGDVYGYQLAGELVLIISLTTVIANSYRQALQRAIELKVESDGLAAKLRIQTLAAEAARGEAEIANRAKTQFFTAASHDLRQPLHAMGLFAEALRQRAHDPEVAQLVNSINESVDALEGLFSELLDITRIDSGVIEVHAQHFEIGEVLRKLRLHFEPSAFEKGLSLRLRGGAKVLFADPLLVERILRNLVSNAIRYTDNGSILVSCRKRGDCARLEVWDTGMGIGQGEHARIFDEFYQVPHNETTSPEQRKGLGLGLAIVRRLANLMEAPLAVRSELGRGTVFTLELPLGRQPRVPAVAIVGRAPTSLTLDGRLIVVVEDEPAVRAGLEVLLKGWGAKIEVFESVAASLSWAARSDPDLTRPDLLIVDYRLEDGRTGIDAMTGLRARFRRAIPAILVTGSTMTGHEREAQEHDFHLLIKPVLPNKLRAMIAFKLQAKAGPAKPAQLGAEASRT